MDFWDDVIFDVNFFIGVFVYCIVFEGDGGNGGGKCYEGLEFYCLVCVWGVMNDCGWDRKG